MNRHKCIHFLWYVCFFESDAAAQGGVSACSYVDVPACAVSSAVTTKIESFLKTEYRSLKSADQIRLRTLPTVTACIGVHVIKWIYVQFTDHESLNSSINEWTERLLPMMQLFELPKFLGWHQYQQKIYGYVHIPHEDCGENERETERESGVFTGGGGGGESEMRKWK